MFIHVSIDQFEQCFPLLFMNTTMGRDFVYIIMPLAFPFFMFFFFSITSHIPQSVAKKSVLFIEKFNYANCHKDIYTQSWVWVKTSPSCPSAVRSPFQSMSSPEFRHTGLSSRYNKIVPSLITDIHISDAPEYLRAFYRIVGTDPRDFAPRNSRGDPFGAFRTERTLNGRTPEQYERENERIRSANALDYAAMFTKSQFPAPSPPPPDDDDDDDDSDYDDDSDDSDDEDDEDDEEEEDDDDDDGWVDGEYVGPATSVHILPMYIKSEDEYYTAEGLALLELGIPDGVDPDDPYDIYNASPPPSPQRSRPTPTLTIDTRTSALVVPSASSPTRWWRASHGELYYVLPKTPEFEPWVPADRYVSPESNGLWTPYQPELPPRGSPEVARGVQRINGNGNGNGGSGESDKSDSASGDSDSDYEFGNLSSCKPSKKSTNESDDDFKDPSAKKSSATSRSKQSSSSKKKKAASKSKTSSTSNKRKASTAKSQKKRARGDCDIDDENDEPVQKKARTRAPAGKSKKRSRPDNASEDEEAPKPKKPKSQYDPQWNIPNGDLGSWPRDTYEALLKILRRIRTQETAAGKTGVKGLRDIKLWAYASAELKKAGHVRSGSACKLFWGRYGRRESQFDERANPGMLLFFWDSGFGGGLG